ncbi:hypothetical protein [Phycicoccus flavus]|uniref:hypothetical protein n=1 Tax=Phycicoccus flavus TaxID=2502783 RepID=UPI000FEB885B|nr:hypothetical protein [Phycicoccus flavus]NHA69447.1 hypothetical protein [Phycicoccus flavus]
MGRAVLAAVVVDVVVVLVLQKLLLLLQVVTVPAAALVAGVVLAALASERERVLVPAAVIGASGTLVAMVLLSAQGTPVLSSVYLAGWVVTLLLGAGVGAGGAWLAGRVAERSSTDPRTLR